MYEKFTNKWNLLEDVLLHARYAVEEENGENSSGYGETTPQSTTALSLVFGANTRSYESEVVRLGGSYSLMALRALMPRMWNGTLYLQQTHV